MHTVIVYSRPGCHLCEVMLESIVPLLRGRASLQVRQVDDDPEWADLYGLKVPVLLVDDREICHFHLDRQALEAALAGSP